MHSLSPQASLHSGGGAAGGAGGAIGGGVVLAPHGGSSSLLSLLLLIKGSRCRPTFNYFTHSDFKWDFLLFRPTLLLSQDCYICRLIYHPSTQMIILSHSYLTTIILDTLVCRPT